MALAVRSMKSVSERHHLVTQHAKDMPDGDPHMQVQPFSTKKQTAVRTGVANAVGVAPADVALELQNVFPSQVYYGARHSSMALENGVLYPSQLELLSW